MTTEESTIDTSRMSEGERAAMEATEAAREVAMMERTFAGGMFLGRYDLTRIQPFPGQSAEDRDQGDAFLQRLGNFLREQVDPDSIDESGEIPNEVMMGSPSSGRLESKFRRNMGTWTLADQLFAARRCWWAAIAEISPRC